MVKIEDLLISDESTVQACPNMGTKGAWGFEKPKSIEGSKDQGWKLMFSGCVGQGFKSKYYTVKI